MKAKEVRVDQFADHLIKSVSAQCELRKLLSSMNVGSEIIEKLVAAADDHAAATAARWRAMAMIAIARAEISRLFDVVTTTDADRDSLRAAIDASSEAKTNFILTSEIWKDLVSQPSSGKPKSH